MFMVSEKGFCLPQHKFLTVVVDYKEIYYLNNMILHFFPSYGVFHIQLYATVWQKLITVAKGKAKTEMSPFS